MDEQNTFDGYFQDVGVPEPNATEIPKAYESEIKPDVVINDNYQDYTAQFKQQIPVSNPYYTNYSGAGDSRSKETTGLGIASLVMGILTLLFLCCLFPLTLPLALIFGIIGIVLYMIDRKNSSSGVSKAGFICSLIGLIISVLLIVLIVLVVVINASVGY